MPDFASELAVWKLGHKIVAGMDEVGRGALAGPVVAAAVAFASNSKLEIRNQRIKINDSKKLSSKQREDAAEWIKHNAAAFGVGMASVSEINRFGIKKATEIAFRQAILNCKLQINYLLIDAFYVPYVRGLGRKHQKAIIKGDTKSFSIAAASIIAKVYRDQLMSGIENKYGWEINKGYGTLRHREAIKKHGPTKYHRTLFIRNFVSSQV